MSIPLYGHLRPLIIQARALARRGWDVRVASLDEARSVVEPQVPFEGLGANPPGAPATAEVFAEATANPSFREGARAIMSWVHSRWANLYDGGLSVGRLWQPDLIASDVVTTAGIDVADSLGVPLVLNNADVLPMVSEAILPPAPDVPLMLLGQARSRRTRWEKVSYRSVRWVALKVARRFNRRALDSVRAARGLPRVDPLTQTAGRRVLVNTVFGLEYERPLPPEIQLVGPMLDDSEPALDAPLTEWLSDGPPVVYVNLGTVAAPAVSLIQELARALEDRSFRALWVLRGEAAEVVHRTAPSIRVERWVPSQLAVLRHPNVRAFVSHCGVNSVHEAVACGVPIVGIPLFADQQDMALRALDAGVAVVLAKQSLAAAEVRAAVDRVIRDPVFRQPMPALQAAMLSAGGVERAADLLEEAAGRGREHLGARPLP